MTEETFKRQQPFAGEKKPSMLRRAVWNDYTDRRIYMVTLVTEGRQPLFGRVIGHSEAPAGSAEAPAISLSPLGFEVEKEWWASANHHPELSVVALQMMPDHLHGILFVKEKMAKPLGMIIRGFKQACNRHYRELVLGLPPVQSVALATQQTRRQKTNRRGEDRSQGLLFARNYNDRILYGQGQLDRWLHYLADNPRRLLMKREHPDLFRVQRNVEVAGLTFSAIGNRFLLDHPDLLQVQCSRSMKDSEIKAYVDSCLTACRQGAILVSPSISPGEKAAMRAAFEGGFPLIYLQENGFTELAKPGGKRMEACADGRLLILAPWEHHNERTAISRSQCLSLNEMARAICSQGARQGSGQYVALTTQHTQQERAKKI